MLKIIFVGIWVVLVFTSSLYLGSGKLTGTESGSGGKGVVSAKLEPLKLNPISVPFIIGGNVQGYLIVESAIMYSTNGSNKNLPIDLFVQDSIVSYLFNNDEVNPERLDKLDMNLFRSKLKDSMNTSLNGINVNEVLVQRLDYLSVQEVRDKRLRAG